MKVLLLLRHADSGDKLQGQTDKERGLTNRGIQQSGYVAAFMKEKDLIPDHILASDAIRVKSTLEIMISQLRLITEVNYLGQLYDADTDVYLDAVRKAPDCQVLLIAGHNPGITTFASFICKSNLEGVGTANVLVFRFQDNGWSGIDKSKCELIDHFVPPS